LATLPFLGDEALAKSIRMISTRKARRTMRGIMMSPPRRPVKSNLIRLRVTLNLVISSVHELASGYN